MDNIIEVERFNGQKINVADIWLYQHISAPSKCFYYLILDEPRADGRYSTLELRTGKFYTILIEANTISAFRWHRVKV